MSKTNKDSFISFRVEPELKARLERVAGARYQKPGAFTRQALIAVLDALDRTPPTTTQETQQ